MILPLTRPLVALDLETDGFGQPEQSRVVEIGFKILYPPKRHDAATHDDPTVTIEVDGREPKLWSSLVYPERPISPEAFKIHGISDAMVRGCRHCGRMQIEHETTERDHSFGQWPTFKQLAPNLSKGLSDVDFCGYSVRFDLRVLAAEFERVGVEWSSTGARLLDGSALWRLAVPRSLTHAVREFLQREPTQAHRALGDAEDALEVALAMLERFPQLPRDLSKLHEMSFDMANIDPDGKFVWKDGEAVMGFGKHKGRKLREMPLDYLEWMARGEFSVEVRRIVKDALEGKWPTKP